MKIANNNIGTSISPPLQTPAFKGFKSSINYEEVEKTVKGFLKPFNVSEKAEKGLLNSIKQDLAKIESMAENNKLVDVFAFNSKGDGHIYVAVKPSYEANEGRPSGWANSFSRHVDHPEDFVENVKNFIDDLTKAFSKTP